MNWTKTDDELPVTGVPVLGIFPNFSQTIINICQIDDASCWTTDDDFCCSEPTHWMLIPEPPIKELIRVASVLRTMLD